MNADQLRSWMEWRRKQDAATGLVSTTESAPADPQLDKAVELLRAALKALPPE